MRGIYKVLILALVVAACLAPFASSSPDGLEKVAHDLGFIEKGAGDPYIQSPVPDYTFPGIKNPGLATAAAGVVGTAATFGVMYALAKAMKRKSPKA